MKDLPRKRFRAILADPPWHFRTWSKRGRGRSPDRHYRQMSLAQIKAIPVLKCAKRNCALFLWVSWPQLHDALEVIEAWGFKYKTVAFVWVKCTGGGRLHWGLGYWTRANTEVCLLATRGKPRRRRRDVHQVIIAERREHSRKPANVHERIERLVRGPYLELFARARRRGWMVWGNDVDRFVSDNQAAAADSYPLRRLGHRAHPTRALAKRLARAAARPRFRK